MSQGVEAEPFVEVLVDEKSTKSENDVVEAYTSPIEPKYCGPLLKELAKRLPFGKQEERNYEELRTPVPSLSHLKRVRRQTILKQESTSEQQRQKEESNSDTRKRRKLSTQNQNMQLEVVLGPVQTIDSYHDSPWLADTVEKYGLILTKKNLPAQPAESLQEAESLNRIWPTIYFHKQSRQHQQEELTLTDTEIQYMEWGIQEAIQDAHRIKIQTKTSNDPKQQQFPSGENVANVGAVVCCPDPKRVVAHASHEQQEQTNTQRYNENPLLTPTLLAIQGVSRIERRAAMGHGMDSDAFQKGQYLCTGYDLFTTKEPDVFEAMACLHSRIRRVIFGFVDNQCGGLGGGGIKVHSLPGTNHKFRVFYCGPNTELAKRCKQLNC